MDPSKKKATEASADRDPSQQSQQDSRRNIKLSAEQINEAYEAFLVSLSGSGLSAEQRVSDDGMPQFVVKGPTGTVMRVLGYFAIVDVWLDRHKTNPTGRLLSRSA